jgi:hypothetical protein
LVWGIGDMVFELALGYRQLKPIAIYMEYTPLLHSFGCSVPLGLYSIRFIGES